MSNQTLSQFAELASAGIAERVAASTGISAAMDKFQADFASTGIAEKVAAMSGMAAVAEKFQADFASTGVAEKLAASTGIAAFMDKFQADFASTGVAEKVAASTGIAAFMDKFQADFASTGVAEKVAAMSGMAAVAEKFQADFAASTGIAAAMEKFQIGLAASTGVAAAQVLGQRAVPDLGPLFRQLPNVAAIGDDMVPQFSLLATQLFSSRSLLPSIDEMAAQILTGPYQAESAAHEVQDIAARLLDETDIAVLTPTDLDARSMVSTSQFAVIIVLVFIVTAAFSPEMRDALAAQAVTAGLLLEMAHHAISSSPSLEGALEVYGLFTLIGGIVRLLQKGLHDHQGDE